MDDLPDEVILNMLGFLDIKELLLCGQVSKRLQAIANDESLWLKLNLYYRKVPYDFIEKAAGNGCQYLSLFECDIIGLTEKSKSSFNLKYLNVCGWRQGVQKLVQNCRSLQKLSVANLTLDSDDIKYICQNSQTLQVLNIEECKLDLSNHTELIKDLFTNCAHLTELNIGTDYRFLDIDIQALVDNLTPTILKVNLGGQENLQDEHVKKLVKRCNKITHLDLNNTKITNDSVHSIIEHLKTSLEELNVCGTDVDFASLLQLKSMPALKALIALICFDPDNDHPCDHHPAEIIENLKQQLHHIRINKEEQLNIASPFKIVNESIDFDWSWEIRAKEQDLFAKKWY